MYGVTESTTLYNLDGNSKCERFNWTLHDLLKSLPKSQKPNWPAHLNALVFVYNATPNSITGLQPYQLMFGHKAQTPCDNWLGLNNYDSDESVSKSSWLQEHQKLMQAANQSALKSTKKSPEKSSLRRGGKELSILEGNLVLLCDYPEGCNKIHDCFKDQEFVVVKQLYEPNVYWIKPVNGVSQEWVVNCGQLQDLQKAHDNNDNTSNKEAGNVPSFDPKVKLKDETPHTHRYATQCCMIVFFGLRTAPSLLVNRSS